MECYLIWFVQTRGDKVTSGRRLKGVNLWLWLKCCCTLIVGPDYNPLVWISHSIKYLLIVTGFSSWLLEPWDTQHLLSVDVLQTPANQRPVFESRGLPWPIRGQANVTRPKKPFIVMQMANDSKLSRCHAAHTFPTGDEFGRWTLNLSKLIWAVPMQSESWAYHGEDDPGSGCPWHPALDPAPWLPQSGLLHVNHLCSSSDDDC